MSKFKSIQFSILSSVAAAALTFPVRAAEVEQTLALDARILHSIRIINGVGSLHIQGVDDSETIEAVGRIVGGKSNRRFTLQADGDTAVLVATNTERHFVFEWFGEVPRIDVVVKVPSRLMLEVNDRAGDIAMVGMKAKAIVTDENGAIQIADHHGALNVYDGQGEIKLERIYGQVYVQDGQGHLSVEQVVGNVDINDGNGSIVVKDIDGRVSIHDGNGGVAAANVTKGVTVNDGRSGQLAAALVEPKD